MKKRPIDIICSILAFILTPLFFISFSALIPCCFRPFYYMWIDPLKIPQTSGYSRSVIIEAFDDVMDFLWNGAEFKTGQLAWTEEEKAHFEDCKPLFHMQLILALITGILLVTYIILIKKKVLKTARFKGISSISWGGALAISLLLIVGIFAAIDFTALFTVFHKVFFPGKGNWQFDYETEQIINILPESFFLVCAIFIISLVIILSTVALVIGIVKRERKEKIKQ
ncbi:MAG: TIGR01906 family membrane protein [Bacilli bacterium]|nr:TIGR01906 family membrane protein [Bacilli bacterium]